MVCVFKDGSIGVSIDYDWDKYDKRVLLDIENGFANCLKKSIKKLGYL